MHDSGTSHFLLSMLKTSPADTVKSTASLRATFSTAVLAQLSSALRCPICHSVDTKVCLEDVAKELQLVRSMQLDYIQGYFLSHPMPVTNFQRLFKRWHP